MRAISEVLYTDDGHPYQCVVLDEDEVKRSIPLKDFHSDFLVLNHLFPLPFRREDSKELK